MPYKPEELFEKIMKEAPIYDSSSSAISQMNGHIEANGLVYSNWKQVKLTKLTKLRLELLNIGESYCLTYEQFEKVGIRRVYNLQTFLRKTQNPFVKFAIIDHKTLFVYEIARLW